MPLAEEELARLSALCRDLHEERFLAREGFRLAMRGYLALLAIAVARLAASRARTGAMTLRPADPTVEALRALLEEHFRKERLLGFYAEKLAMTPDRLNDIVKRATGVTAGHLIRQRVLTEAKRQLVFTSLRDPRDRLRPELLRPVALRALLPQADRHDAAGVSREGGRVARRVIASEAKQSRATCACARCGDCFGATRLAMTRRAQCSHGSNASDSFTSILVASWMNLSIALTGRLSGLPLQKSATSLVIVASSIAPAST